MSLEVLHFLLVLFRLFERRESSEVSTFPRSGRFLFGVEAILSGFEFANHVETRCRIDYAG